MIEGEYYEQNKNIDPKIYSDKEKTKEKNRDTSILLRLKRCSKRAKLENIKVEEINKKNNIYKTIDLCAGLQVKEKMELEG